jgi:TonB-linked SusC/RagA family outer membrane protein
MRIVYALFFLFFLVMLQPALAQTKEVRGTVTDSSGKPLSGASIQVRNSSVGTRTDDNGAFTLQVPQSNATLVISNIGFEEQQVPVGNQQTLRITMYSGRSVMQEVVVTALGIARDRRSLGYATQTVKGSDIANKGELNVVNALQGRLAGVNITGASGSVGSSTNINIRGIHSFTQSNQPLFVVDGIPVSNNLDRTNGGTLGSNGDFQPPNRALDIDPNNIESINVLKGGAAAALYGSRAANGVIVITTKKGSSRGGRADITLSSSYSIQNVYGLLEYQNEYGQGLNGLYSSISGNSWGPKIGSTPTLANGLLTATGQAVPFVAYPNNIKDFFEQGYVFDNNLSINGGDQNQNYTFSLGNSRQTGIVPNTHLTRTNVRFGANTMIRSKMRLGGNVTFTNSGQQGVLGGNGSSAIGALTGVTRTTDLQAYKRDGSYKNVDGTNNWYVPSVDNPYFSAYENPVTSNLTRVIGTVNLGYDLATWLNIGYKLGVDAYTDRRKQIFAKSSNQRPAGQALDDIFYRNEITGQLLINAKKNDLFIKGVNATLLLGQEINQRKFQNVTLQGDQLTIPNYYNANNATVFTNGSQETNFTRRLVGVFGQASLSYNNYLFLELTGRADKSSTLPINKNTYFYPSASASFVFTDAFHIQSNILSYGKIRASYAKVGNDAPPYRLNNYYIAGTYGNNVAQLNLPITAGGTTLSGFAANTRLASQNLSPEFTTSYEGGFNVGLFKNRASIDVAYFKEVSKDQIFDVSLAPSSGFATQTTNVGEMQNRGWEALVNITALSLRNLKWDISANYTRIRNKVVSISPGITQSALSGTGSVFAGTSGTNAFTGSIPSIVQGQAYGVIVGSKLPRSPDGQFIINPVTGTFAAGIAGQVLADPNPDYRIGITNTITYKIFTLSALVDYKEGGDIVSFTAGFGKSAGTLKETAVDRDKPRIIPGVILDPATNKYIPNNIQIPAQLYWRSFGLQSDLNVYDATVFRFRELTLGINIPATVFNTRFISGARFSVFARNLFYIAPNAPLDPEVNTSGASNIQGLELQSAPNNRSIGVNLNISF